MPFKLFGDRMKTAPLLVYLVTRDLFSEFKNNQLVQPIILNDWNKLVLTDFPAHDIYMNCLYTSIFPFNFSKYINRALSFAKAGKRSHLLIAHCDTIIDSLPNPLPENGITAATADFRDGSPPRKTSVWLLGRDIIENESLRCCEEFTGYGYEDMDFLWNVLQPAGVQFHDCPDFKIRHLPHFITRLLENNIIKNKELYERRHKNIELRSQQSAKG